MKEGLSCLITYHGSGSRGQSFRLIRQAFLQGDGLPFGDVLGEEEIERAFEAEGACVAQGEGDIYTPAITLWAFLDEAASPREGGAVWKGGAGWEGIGR